MNEKDIDVVYGETYIDKYFQKSDTEIETYESIENLKYPQEKENVGNITLDDLNERELNNPRVQAMFKRSRYNNLSNFIISQDYYELPKGRLKLMLICTTILNLTTSETYKISIKIKQTWR